eukprot:gene17637-12627_t
METVFVGNLSYFCTETVLRNVFQPYGTVQSAIIRKTKANQTLFYGFVQMKTSQEAANAVANLDGCFVQGRHMKVSISKSAQVKAADNDHFIQTRVSFITHNTRQQVNETLLHRIFSRFGEVADCVVKQYEITHQPRARQCGYAYVYFLDVAAAKRAISSLCGDRREEIESIRMDCKLSLESAQKLQDILSLDDRSVGSQSTQPLHGGEATSVSPALRTKSGDEDRGLSANHAEESLTPSPVSMPAESFASCRPLEPRAVSLAHCYSPHVTPPHISPLPVPRGHFTTQRVPFHPAAMAPLQQAQSPPAAMPVMQTVHLPMHTPVSTHTPLPMHTPVPIGMQQMPASANHFAPAPFVLPSPANAPPGAVRLAPQHADPAPVYMVYPSFPHHQLHQQSLAHHVPYAAPQLRQQFVPQQQQPMLMSLAIRQ